LIELRFYVPLNTR